jgi:hypothetical protein
MSGSFQAAYVVAAVLRENLSAQFWSSALRQVSKYMQNNTLVFGEYPEDHMTRYIWSIPERLRGSEDRGLFMIHHSRQKGPAIHGEDPRITVADIISGTWSAIPRGKFEVLRWRSPIPPYYSYVHSCELVQNKNTRTEP